MTNQTTRYELSSRSNVHHVRSFTLTLRGTLAADVARVLAGTLEPTAEILELAQTLKSATDARLGSLGNTVVG